MNAFSVHYDPFFDFGNEVSRLSTDICAASSYENVTRFITRSTTVKT
jgi:hypothetical protein